VLGRGWGEGRKKENNIIVIKKEINLIIKRER